MTKSTYLNPDSLLDAYNSGEITKDEHEKLTEKITENLKQAIEITFGGNVSLETWQDATKDVKERSIQRAVAGISDRALAGMYAEGEKEKHEEALEILRANS